MPAAKPSKKNVSDLEKELVEARKLIGVDIPHILEPLLVDILQGA